MSQIGSIALGNISGFRTSRRRGQRNNKESFFTDRLIEGAIEVPRWHLVCARRGSCMQEHMLHQKTTHAMSNNNTFFKKSALSIHNLSRNAFRHIRHGFTAIIAR
ncbi:MAG: hypothetical protein ACXVB4_03170 [Pseudobdellovibrionaceae bacterium]